MEDKKIYNVVLIDGSFKDVFLQNLSNEYEVVNVLEYIPSVIRINLTEVQKQELLNDIYVVTIEEEEEAFPASVSFNNKTLVVNAQSSSTSGSLYASAIHKYLTNATGISGKLGAKSEDDFSTANANYFSEVSGEHIDIVTLEAGSTTSSLNNYHLTHPEWKKPGTITSRCVPMNWGAYHSSVTSNSNTNQSTTMFSEHAAGVLSAAGGVLGGLAKNASLRAAYLNSTDSEVNIINAIINWHNSKPTNLTTGQKNPTIVIGEFQYLQSNTYAVPVSQVKSINYRGTTINRPSGGWDMNTFLSYNIFPKRVRKPSGGYEWCLTISTDMNLSLKNSIESMISNGIHFITAAGNDCGIYAKYNSADWDNYFTTDTTFTQYMITLGYAITSNTYAGPNYFYYHKSRGPHGVPNAIDVAAFQASEAVPSLDGYSVRGPGIDICGLGNGTWTAYPSTTYSDGYKYGIFGGTSSATPTVVGVAACMLEYYFKANGSYPSPATLKSLLINNGVNKLQSYNSVNWSSPPEPHTYIIASALIDGTDAVKIVHTDFLNGYIKASELVGTTTKIAFLPDYMRTYAASTSQCKDGQGKRWNAEIRWALYRNDGVKVADWQTKNFDLRVEYKNNQGFNASHSDSDTWNFDQMIDLDPEYSHTLGLEVKNTPYDQCECADTQFDLNCSGTGQYNSIGFKMETKGYYSETRAVYPYDKRPDDPSSGWQN